jgi:hypothetical protein
MDSAEGHKGGKHYYKGRTTIHINAIENTTNHKGVKLHFWRMVLKF